MIDRYTLPEMKPVWTEEAKFGRWMRVEWAVCEALASGGVIPPKDWRELRRRWKEIQVKRLLQPGRIVEIENDVKHDVIAFTTALAEVLGPTSRWVHYGLTSSDVVDTALSLALVEAGGLIAHEIEALLTVLKRRAQEFQGLAAMGRSHGMYAEPTSFGLKFLGWFEEWKRNQQRWARAVEGVRFGKLSGAVGAGSFWGPAEEKLILKKLGLEREPVSTQVIPRDRHAELFSASALCGASLERIAVELRHLQRSEVAEVREAFSKKQKGSSAMPHKRNPISSENVTGAARLLRAYANAGFENVALWHERDISHSSVERVIVPDALTLLHYAIRRLAQVLKNLEVDRVRISARVKEAGPLARSGHLLLALVRAGVSREEAYGWIQSCALEAIDAGAPQSFLDRLRHHPEISKHLDDRAIRKWTSSELALRNVKAIYREAK